MVKTVGLKTFPPSSVLFYLRSLAVLRTVLVGLVLRASLSSILEHGKIKPPKGTERKGQLMWKKK